MPATVDPAVVKKEVVADFPPDLEDCLLGPVRYSPPPRLVSFFDHGSRVVSRRSEKQVFVAYPYGLIDRKDYRGVFARLGKAYGVSFVYADEKLTNVQIAEKIRRQIQMSDFSLFDITGWNANVAFELGIAYEMGADWYICFNPALSGQAEVPANIRGLDRIQYDGFAELQEKLTPLMEQWYPQPPPRETLDEFAEKMKEGIVDLLRHHPGLSVREIAKGARVNPETVAVTVRQLKAAGKLIQAGKSSAARYRLKNTTT